MLANDSEKTYLDYVESLEKRKNDLKEEKKKLEDRINEIESMLENLDKKAKQLDRKYAILKKKENDFNSVLESLDLPVRKTKRKKSKVTPKSDTSLEETPTISFEDTSLQPDEQQTL